MSSVSAPAPHGAVLTVPSSRRTPNDIIIARKSMFYGRAVKKNGHKPPERRIIAGLPSKRESKPRCRKVTSQPYSPPLSPSLSFTDILRSVTFSHDARSAQGEPKKRVAPQTTLSPAQLQRLQIHIFPGQFRLETVFDPVTVSGTRRNYADRTADIDAARARASVGGKKALSVKTEGRMKGKILRALIEEMWSRNARFDYFRTRAICCPSKVRPSKSH